MYFIIIFELTFKKKLKDINNSDIILRSPETLDKFSKISLKGLNPYIYKSEGLKWRIKLVRSFEGHIFNPFYLN